MQRAEQTFYQSDGGRKLITLWPDGGATIEVCTVTAAELDELATAAMAAANELRARAYVADTDPYAPTANQGAGINAVLNA